MNQNELLEAKKQLLSLQSKTEKALQSLIDKADEKRYRSQITLSKRRVEALKLALELIETELGRG